MSIQGISLKFKGLLQNTEIQLAILIVAVSLVSFFLGRVSMTQDTSQNHEIREITQVGTVMESTTVIPAPPTVPLVSPTPVIETKTPSSTIPATTGAYVGSKNGTKYHLPWCGSAKLIKEENRVWFASKEEAEKAGYIPASTCKGI